MEESLDACNPIIPAIDEALNRLWNYRLSLATSMRSMLFFEINFCFKKNLISHPSKEGTLNTSLVFWFCAKFIEIDSKLLVIFYY